MNYKLLIAVLAPVLTAVASDLRQYAKARSDADEAGKPAPAFDWAVAASRWLDGGIVALLAGLGMSAVGP